MNDDLKWNLLQARVHRLKTLEVYEKLTSFGVDCVILKGAAVARFYPDDKPRISVDIDVGVSPEQFENTLNLNKDGEFRNALVDVHKGIRHFDTREWPEVFKETKTIDLEEGRIRVLRDEDQLRMIAVHWLTDGGEREDRLWDIHYLVRGRPADFDWDYFLEANGPLRRRWLTAVIGLANRYTGLNIDDLPYAEEYADLPDWLVRTLESRWADDVKFSPLDQHFRDPLMLLKQLKRRLPPNAVMATIALEEDFDKGARLPMQIRYIFKQASPSFRRSIGTLWNLITR